MREFAGKAAPYFLHARNDGALGLGFYPDVGNALHEPTLRNLQNSVRWRVFVDRKVVSARRVFLVRWRIESLKKTLYIDRYELFYLILAVVSVTVNAPVIGEECCTLQLPQG